MDRPAFSEHTDVMSWLILGYLYANPDAKDTVDGVEKWWLSGIESNMNASTIQGSLDYLVKLGWLVSNKRQGIGTVYGLNIEQRDKLRQIVQRTGLALESRTRHRF